MNKVFTKKEFINEFLIDVETNAYNTGDETNTVNNNLIKSNNTTDYNAIQNTPTDNIYGNKSNLFGYFFEELISKKDISEFIKDDEITEDKYLSLINSLTQMINKKDDSFKINFIVKLMKNLNIAELNNEDKNRLLKKLTSDNTLI